MKKLTLFFTVLVLVGCGGEKKDEMGPYVIKLREFDSVYVQKLIQYREYLSTDGMAQKAADIEVVMQDFYDALKQYPEINDKKVKALHNELARTVKGSMRKLVEPDFPTFVPNAQSAIRMVVEELTVIHRNLEKLWIDSGRTDAFTLEWNFPSE
tara:strand:- start:12117 stop:12578 length:462 start_codon:yes stop_codon:yes gene_type:complete